MNLRLSDLFPERSVTSPSISNLPGEYLYKTTVVTGGAGSIGSAVVETLLKSTQTEVWILDNDESRVHSLYSSFTYEYQSRLHFYITDIRDGLGLNQRLERINPDMIIHAAALKHVPILERQPRDGFYTNVVGTQNLLDYLKTNIRTGLIFVSSDKAANPKSILGKTKFIGELLVGSQISRDRESGVNRLVAIVRFGNVFLSRGSVIETFIAQIEIEQSLTVTDTEMTRYFMDIDQAANLILHVLVMGLTGISIFKMGEPIKIMDIAKRLLELTSAANQEIAIIGKKDGEKIHEDLFSESELLQLRDLGPILNSSHFAYLKNETQIDVPKSDEEAKDFIESLLKPSTIQLG